MIYLIHFKSKLHHAQHYLGFCEDGNLDARIERHKQGNGSKLLRAVNIAGIEWEVVRVWDGDRHFERALKNKKHAQRICPICLENRHG
jgi:hypothetical protein